jgi:hypothetical protein
MKVSLKLAAALIATTVLAFGCSTGSGSGSSDSVTLITAPDVGKVEDLKMTGAATSFNDTQSADAVNLFMDATSALNQNVKTKLNTSQKSISEARTVAGMQQPAVQSYDANYSVGGGTVSYHGSTTSTVGGIDESTQMQANKRYNGFITYLLAGTVNGEISNVTITTTGSSSQTYVINGIVKNTVSMNFSFDIVTGSASDGSGSKAYLNFGFGIGAGYALSVVRQSDGLGAKFILSYAANYGMANTDCDSIDMTLFGTEMTNYLAKQNAQLKVYDKDNNLVLTDKVPMSQAYSTSILSNAGSASIK